MLPMTQDKKAEKDIKCVVWDLDGTIWDGILLESDEVTFRPRVREIVEALDSRGVLHSIASKNHYGDAMKKLKEFGLDEFFLYPEITWDAKSLSLERIQKNLNISMDSIMFIDDDRFEREEVQHVHPDVECIDAAYYQDLLYDPRLNPRSLTTDASARRMMYMADIERKEAEDEYKGPRKDFLASLNMKFTISKAKEEDLNRAEELTIRTNQLNATGTTYSHDDLRQFIHSDRHELLICDLEDKFGSYGKIGLALIETMKDYLHLRLLLMSCRVMSRGVGTVLLSHIMNKAKAVDKKLRADFRDTGRNRMMHIAFKFAGFRNFGFGPQDEIILENDLSAINSSPPYMKVLIR
jgi:FkbH-like protein